jgi:hypothetical protein
MDRDPHDVYKGFCKYLEEQYKGTGHINVIRKSIDVTCDLYSLRNELVSRGMFPGSLEIIFESYMDGS